MGYRNCVILVFLYFFSFNELMSILVLGTCLCCIKLFIFYLLLAPFGRTFDFIFINLPSNSARMFNVGFFKATSYIFLGGIDKTDNDRLWVKFIQSSVVMFIIVHLTTEFRKNFVNFDR
uniref:(northern house mosquito) hypothetical protein n=1 Tax=Culex pipiens TaxID=7175 RepID=A0A8D8NE66_CULPI